MAKWVDDNALAYLWERIKNKFVAKVDGKGLSTNDYTSTEKNKLAGIADGANKYIHPTHTAYATGLYKVTVDAAGHVTSAVAVSKADITGLGIPGQDTTYGLASQSANGLMAKTDKAKLDGIATGANKYIHPEFTARASGLYKVTVDANGHVIDVAAVTKADITALGIPGQDTNTTYSNMGAATSSAAGRSGLVPAPAAGKQTSFLRGDGTWVIPTNTTYGVATSSSNGLMAAGDKSKLDGYPAYGTIQSTYATKQEIIGMYKYKGSVSDASKLPTTGQKTGDVYNIETASAYGQAGANVAWNGSNWDTLGEIFTMTALTNAEIDAICV